MTTVDVAGHVSWFDSAGDLILFNGADGSYHALDAIGSAIWRVLGRGASIDTAVSELRETFVAEGSTIEQDLARFVDQAIALGLLVKVGE